MATMHTMRDQAVPAPAPAGQYGSYQYPPVIIINMFYSGLGIARDLAGRKVRVVGLSADPTIYGNFTRCCEVRIAPNSQEQPEQLAEMLLRLSSELGGAVIFPTRDADVLFLDRFRLELEPHYRLAIAPHDELMRVINKDELAAVAEKANVPVPRTAVIRSASELYRVESEIGFPCVLKPVKAVNWRGKESWIKVGARKALRVDDVSTLRREYELLSTVDPEVLVQQWIPGGSDQIVVLGGYVRQNSELDAYFTARKLVQSPDDFGTGCLVESADIPEVVELSRRLFKALNYRGMAEVEYKHHPASGEYYLIEINTRHWDWHRLGSVSGINLSWTAYSDLIGQEAETRPMRTARGKWIAEDALLVYLLRAIYHRRIRPGDLVRKLAGPRVYAVSAWNDPRPGLRYGFLEFLPSLAKAGLQNIFRGGLL
jgi:predicted ATP-grasp superfamily ATP-dependent carboligase